jgi:hypothetical protein
MISLTASIEERSTVSLATRSVPLLAEIDASPPLRQYAVSFQSRPSRPIPATVRGDRRCGSYRTKKADVSEPTKGYGHTGLLVNEPPGTAGLLSV